MGAHMGARATACWHWPQLIGIKITIDIKNPNDQCQIPLPHPCPLPQMAHLQKVFVVVMRWMYKRVDCYKVNLQLDLTQTTKKQQGEPKFNGN